MRSLPLIILLLTFAGKAWAQVESQPTPRLSLDRGIVVEHESFIPFGQPEVTLLRTEGAPVELTDFSLSFVLQHAVAHESSTPATLLTVHGESESLEVSLNAGDTFEVRLGDVIWQTQLPQPAAGTTIPVTLSVKRDPRQSLAGLWLDGVEQLSLRVPPGRLRLKSPPATCGNPSREGGIAHLRLYSRALDRPEILYLALAAKKQPKQPLPPFTSGSFQFLPDETMAVMGGSEAVALLEDGHMEALLLAHQPQRRLKIRNLAWETDTVWRQDRPLHFGDLPQQLQRVDATSVLLMFGRQECLERGMAGVAKFRQALEELVAACRGQTPRIVLVTPAWFESGTPPQPDLRPLNDPLRAYQEAIMDLARHHNLPVVPPPQPPGGEMTLTSDGITLSTSGTRHWAAHIATFLCDADFHPQSAPSQALLAAIRAKNRLWHEYWRPSNWAFLYGDRTAQPSSRDHLNPQVRWFPGELERSREMLQVQEQKIWRLADTKERQVP